MQDTDFARLPKDTLLIFTDFAAVMALRASQAKNSSIDAHAINDNFVCVFNRRNVDVKEMSKKKSKKSDGEAMSNEMETIEIFTIDVHHLFAETISKGKKNDHAMHNVSLDALITQHQRIFPEAVGVPLAHVIVWTDNAPHQYRCRQNFIKVASVVERHEGIKVTHRLAVVDNFKGIHDAVGKDPAHLVRSLELMNIRSPTGFAVFENCYKFLQKTRDDTKWLAYEIANDARLKNKKRWEMDSRTV